MRAVRLGVEGGESGNGNGGGIRRGVATAAVGVGAESSGEHGSVMGGELGVAPSPNWTLLPLGPGPIPDGCGSLAVPGTAPSWRLLALQRDSTGWQLACS